MGNTPSVQRSTRDEGAFEELVPIPDTSSSIPLGDDGRGFQSSRRSNSESRSPSSNRRRNSIYQTIMRRRSVHPTTSPAENRTQNFSSEGIDEQEHRPLVDTSDLEVQDNQDSTMDISRSLRRRSTISRLSSIFSTDANQGDLPNSQESEHTRRISHPYNLSVRSPTNAESQTARTANRYSLSGSIRRRLRTRRSQLIEDRRQTIRGSIRGPVVGPFSPDHHDQEYDPSLFERQNTSNVDISQTFSSSPRQSLLTGVRNSFFRPLSELLGHRRGGSHTSSSGQPTSGRSTRVTFAEDSDQLLPSLTTPDHRVEHDEHPPHELDAAEPETRNLLSGARVTSGMSTIRRFPHGLRPRSTRLLRRGEHPPLSHVLQLAAAAIAAQLSSHNAGNNTTGRPLGGEAFNGSIQNFVQTLQDAASAQAGEEVDVNAAEGELPPVNFMRVFQFPNDENGTPLIPQSPTSRDPDPMDIDTLANPIESDRSVTLVLVGVRSMPHGQEGGNGEDGTLGPSLDTLLSLPFLPPANVLRNGSSGALFRRTDPRSRTNHRRHSMTNFNFPAQYESQRHHRTRASTNRSLTDQSLLSSPVATGTPTPVSESPPGPHPPPSTPADIRSGYATPNRRPSSASAVHSSILPELDETQPRSSSLQPPTETSFNTSRQRRRSDSEFARRPELGSGAARRNGVVEPDHPPMGIGRSWLIYVVGTNVSPDHPAFTMPSLFTDNPSYEDMQMLSTLLGPVKPPVATQEDVRSAGGLFRIALRQDTFVAESLLEDNSSPIEMGADDRCLICLGDYEVMEELRQLNRCRHLFHRECVDQWLLTGRNSCPMCRGPGVGDKNNPNAVSSTGSAANDEIS